MEPKGFLHGIEAPLLEARMNNTFHKITIGILLLSGIFIRRPSLKPIMVIKELIQAIIC